MKLVGKDKRFNIHKTTILLPVGNNNTEEIKYCFFHEIKHWLQLLNGTLFITLWSGGAHSYRKTIEAGANNFAGKYQPYRNKFIKQVLASWKMK